MLKQKAARRITNDCPEYLAGPAPFQNSCSIYQFYAGADRGLILDAIIEDLEQTDKPLRIVGESGSGKTMMGLVLAHRVKSKFNVVRYDHPQVSAELLIQHLLIEFCPLQLRRLVAQLSSTTTEVGSEEIVEHDLERRDLEHAVIESGAIKPIVLIVDSPEIDANIWPLLSRLNQLKAKGKPVIRTLVLECCDTANRDRRPAPSSMNEFHSSTGDIHYNLRRLTLSEIHDYLQHHMLLFDFNRRQMFTREMAYFIADRTEGLMREVNLLAKNACTLAGLQNDHEVTMSHLLSAGLPPEPEIKTSRTLRFIKFGGFRLAMLTVSMLVILATYWLTQT
ncbi:MAG: hypothetical protein KTR32_29835 [Granulosicoccus sp.]|nr:hypothetical protein [Granulosicoccus sp.]